MKNIKFCFDNCNYLVTGASSGIGRKICTELALSGANVIAIARRESELKQLKDSFHDKIDYAAIDVCEKDVVKKNVEGFVERKGLLNGFVHCAGLYNFSPLKMFQKEDCRKLMDVNFAASIDLLQFLSKKKFTVNGAAYVLFSSVASIKTEQGLVAYSASKAAVNVAVKTLAKELKSRGQRINAVIPGRIDTPMTHDLCIQNPDDGTILGEGSVEDVAYATLFLLSDGARWITGTGIVVDGGYLIN